MADLLSSLIVTNSPRSSQDSFRSVASHADSPPSSSIKAQSAATTLSSAAAFQQAGLDVYDIDQYLDDNSDLRATPKANKSTAKKPTPAPTGSPEPVSLGTKTSYFISALNSQCQSKGFLPVFEIEGETDFGGVLKLRDVTVTRDQRWPSKKEAREGLAEKGLETVNGMEAKRKEPGTPQEPGKNWVGLLLEYHNLIKPDLPPVYHDYALGSAFASTCTIPSRPDQPFGSLTNAVSSKKGARANAAKEAVEYLIANGDLNPDGSTKSRKKTKLGAAVRIQGKGLEFKKESSYAQKVNDMCPLLGLAPPQYVLGSASAMAPAMVSGYATFANSPSMPAHICEVRNIFGKKNAKEEIAKGVWEVLEKLALKRNVKLSEKEGTDAGGEDINGSDGV